jgi:hypothetical protein
MWASSVGWKNGNLRGQEFRQTQTAISAYFIQRDHDFSLAYPTPILGKPWSVPMEFPLYQWTVVGLSNVTGMGLTPAARLVSLACFYLTLPAVFLLLGEWQVTAGRRWLILGLVVSSPLYIFFARAFLIETMALLFSVWFLLGYLRWMNTSDWRWLVAANAFGLGAGLVKATTLMLYLAPAVAGTLMLLWQNRPSASQPGWRRIGRIVGQGVAAVAVPLALTYWWLHFTDRIKALNPSSEFLVSANLTGYYYGTNHTRFDPAIWAGHWRIISQSVIWLPLAAVSGVAVLVFGRRWWAKVFFCVACFFGIQVLLPELYSWHDYYYVTNALFLLVAVGLAVTTLFDSRLPRWVGGAVLVGMLVGQGYFYSRRFYEELSAVSPEGSDLTAALQKLTQPDEVLLIQGEDWNSMTPYYARRRALMLRAGPDHDETEIRRAFANLKGEKVGALITKGVLDKDAPLLKLAAEYFDIYPQPLLKWRDTRFYLPNKRWNEDYDKFSTAYYHDVEFLPTELPADGSLAGRWYEVSKLSRYQPVSLQYMHPKPVRFFARFGLSLDAAGGQVRFGVHPLTHLIFAVPAGSRHLRTEIGISPGAYENLSTSDATDGVDLKISFVQPETEERLIYSRSVNPRDNPADRGVIPVSLDFVMPADAELKITIEAGPRNNTTRDWAFLGKLTIE